MASLNIRLSVEDAADVKALQREGINVSDIVREAIRVKAKPFRQRKPKTAKEIAATLAAIYAETPGPTPEYIHRGIDTTDRKQMRAFMRERISRPAGKK